MRMPCSQHAVVARWAGTGNGPHGCGSGGGGGVERTVFMDLVRRDALRGVAPRLVGETRGARDIESCSGDAEEGEVPQPSHLHRGGRENYSPPSTRIWVSFIHETFCEADHVGAIFVRFARGGTQAWLLQRGAPRGFFVSAWLGSAVVHPILVCPMAHRSVCAATRAGGKEARNLAIIIMGRGRHEHVDPHTREAFQATPCSLVQQFWHMHAGPQQAISRKWKVPRSFCQPRD